jgi:hypothetical protein
MSYVFYERFWVYGWFGGDWVSYFTCFPIDYPATRETIMIVFNNTTNLYY